MNQLARFSKSGDVLADLLMSAGSDWLDQTFAAEYAGIAESSVRREIVDLRRAGLVIVCSRECCKEFRPSDFERSSATLGWRLVDWRDQPHVHTGDTPATPAPGV